ncbi:hypothetical protein [Gloeothece verrucosa]|uniref:Uncharacterized protein n=1 Tax=Gloeothece verrucosa (strain PCC 7822) TaxID=497965 RepID=E0UIP5_GLOV7|nr:hypothetical protein [Gloeothece verrucosa]ADN13354.1 hypothetical protein Cyan7822_1354 [Gloeothece verrucosa PCC 7822]
MSQVSLLHQAKQGDANAILNLLNQSLAFKKVQIVVATLEDNCLQLKLEGKHGQVPNQHKLIPFIKEEITSLRLEIVHKLELEASVEGSDTAAWQASITLDEHTNRIAEFTHILSAKTDEIEPEEVSLELRAKRGEVAAILELLNQELEPKDIAAELRLDRGYLQILLEAHYALVQDKTVESIRNKLIEARLPLVKKVTIYAKKTDVNIPLWHQDFKNSNKSISNNSLDSSGNSEPTHQPESSSILNKFFNRNLF